MIIIKGMSRIERGTYTLPSLGHALMGYVVRNGRDHAPALSITDDMPEAGGGGESAAAPEVAASDDDGGDGDGDPDSDRRRPRSKTSHPSFPPALLAFEPLSHYVSFGRSRIYQLIAAGEFPQPIKVGKSSRWVKAEIDAWINKQSTSQRVEA
jgi:predicted DNA-binding transcriptional regulator AlpA